MVRPLPIDHLQKTNPCFIPHASTSYHYQKFIAVSCVLLFGEAVKAPCIMNHYITKESHFHLQQDLKVQETVGNQIQPRLLVAELGIKCNARSEQ